MRYLYFILPIALAACNTVNGMGRDIQSLGQGMQSTSQANNPQQPTPLNGVHQGY